MPARGWVSRPSCVRAATPLGKVISVPQGTSHCPRGSGKRGCFLCKCTNQVAGGEREMEALSGSGCGHGARRTDFVCVPAEGVGGSLIAGIWKHLLKIRHQIWTTDRDRRQTLEVCARILFPGPRRIPLSCRPGTQQGSVRLDGGDDSAASKELRGTHRLN